MVLLALHVVWCLLSQGMLSALLAQIARDLSLAACLTISTHTFFWLARGGGTVTCGCCWLFELHEWHLYEIGQVD